MKNSIRFIGLFLIFPFLISCEEEDPEGTSASLAGDWVYESAAIEVQIDGKDFVQYYIDELNITASQAEEIEDLLKEGSNVFENIMLSFDAGGTYAAAFEGDSNNGTWSLNDAGTELLLDAGTTEETILEVLTLSDSKFIFGISEEETDDVDGDNVNETITISLQISMKR